ncbi:MAG: hypothetical protein QOE27_1391 [Solirubrobacteraceae bacterium]|nr:hypothetical protein [Solirubrobacteraceae bacterium]MEA2301612.1 hypothetical protein [Solirubrobacteraceae bacterium]
MRDTGDLEPGLGGGDFLMGVIHLMAPVTAELWDRMEGEVSGKDRMAITTALTKAIEAGMLHGAAEVAALALEEGVEIKVPGPSADLDLWAQRYEAGQD